MYAAEFLTARPTGAAPYYSFVVRDPYVIGSNASCDVCLHCPDILPRLATLTVMRASQQAREESELAARQQQQQQQQTSYRANHVDGNEDLVHTPRNSYTGHSAPHRQAAQPYYSTAGPTSLEDSTMLLLNDEDDESGTERDPLVVRLTILPRHGGEAMPLTAVRVGTRVLQEGESHYLQDGDEVQLGTHVALLFRYRPLLTSIAHDVFAPDYIKDLLFMFHRLGATLCTRPVLRPHHPCPIAALHCVEELSDEGDCLTALAAGYSIVQPTYVFEWFATLAQCASAPLSVLPAPHHFEVPVRCTAYARTTTYLRPESDTCPFSLYPIPTTAVLNRSRAGLFAGRHFLLLGAAVRYATVLRACGADVCNEVAELPTLSEDDIRHLLTHHTDENKEEQRAVKDAEDDTAQVVNQDNALTTAKLASDSSECYIVVNSATEAAVRAYGVDTAAPALAQALRLTGPALPVIGDHDLFSALLSNSFRGQRLPLYGDVPALPLNSSSNNNGGGEDKENGIQQQPPAMRPTRLSNTPRPGLKATTPRPASPRSRYAPEMLLPNVHASRHQNGSARRRVNDMDRNGTHHHLEEGEEEEAEHYGGGARGRLTSLLPRTPNRTPSASQLRSCSRLRGRSATHTRASENESHEINEANEKDVDATAAAAAPSPRRGRRRFVVTRRSPSCSRAALVELDFDTLRIRLYAFLMKAEPRLDAAIASFRRNHFVDTEAMEQALDAVATARDFAAKVRRLRAAPESEAYVDSLTRFAQDCTTLEQKATYLVRCWDYRLRSLSPMATHKAATTRQESETHAYYTPRPRSMSTRGLGASRVAHQEHVTLNALSPGRATSPEERLRPTRHVITPGRTRPAPHTETPSNNNNTKNRTTMNGLAVSAEIAGHRTTGSLISSSSHSSASLTPAKEMHNEATATTRMSGRGWADAPIVHPCRPSRRSQAAEA